MKTSIFVLSLLLLTHNSFSQYNKIRETDILFKKRIVRSIDVKNPVNEGLFHKQNHLVQVLLEAFEKGNLVGYKDDELKETLSLEEYNERVEVKAEEDEVSFRYTSEQLYKVELVEDLIFDKHRSEIVFDLEAITVFIPAEINYRGLLEPLLSFKYDDCMKIFKNDERAFAINPLNNGKNINYTEVFLLKLFRSDIVKIGNEPYFDQMYADSLQAFIARKHAENKLTEYLYKLYNPQ